MLTAYLVLSVLTVGAYCLGVTNLKRGGYHAE